MIKILSTLFLFCYLNCFSQEKSPEFNRIKNDATLTVDEQKVKFQELLQKHRQENNSDFLIADTFEMSRWYWSQESNWPEKSIQLCKKNLEAMDSLKFDNKTTYKRNLYALGYYQYNSYSFNDALDTYKKLLTYKELDLYVLRGAYDIAEIYFKTSQYHLSKDYYNLSKTIAEGQNDQIHVVKSAIGIAEANKLINSPKSLREGIEVLNQAITYIDSNSDIAPTYVHSIYNQLGNLYIDRLDHDFENGKKNLEKALQIAIELNDSVLLNKTYNDLGVLYMKKESKEAELYFEKALVYQADSFTESLIHRNLSIHHLFFNNYTKSLYHIQNSISTLVSLDTSDVTNLPSKLDLSNSNLKFQLIASLINKADIWMKLNEDKPDNKEYLENAISTLNLADFLAEETRVENLDQRSKLFWKKTASDIYIRATKACYLINDPKKAFYYIEKNKAVLLLEDVALKITKNDSEIPKTIIEREQELKNNINALEKRANNTDSFHSQLLLARDEYNVFINSLNADFKFYFKTLQPAKVIDFNTFKGEFLKGDNVYIEYIVEEDEGYGLAITGSDTILFEIKNCEELKNLAIEYRSLIDIPFKDNTSIQHFKTISNKIYRSLFPEEIQPLIKDKVLTIVPDYYLQNIPFEALSTSGEEQSYLIHKNQINYAYSLSFLSENKKVKRTNSNKITAFAPVEFSSQLASLPNTKEELIFIDSAFSAKTFLYKNATKETFLKESRIAKVIHIASHANASDSISPWISFYNNKVDLNDISSLKNSAELVVLSACNTSLGELYKGEGVMSLSRSFFNSGSLTVMPTLWEVNDKATVELVKSFYTNLKQGQNKSLALHNAKLSYIETNSLSQSSPYYWASFVLIGDTGTIEIDDKPTYVYYIIFTLILLIIIFLLFRKKKNKNI